MEPTGNASRRPERPPFGASVDAWESEEAQQGMVVATADPAEFHATVALAAAEALERGVRITDVSPLPPATSPDESPEDRTGLVVGRDRQLQQLNQSLAQLDRRAANARRNSEDSQHDADRKHWLRRARDSAREANRLRRQISDLIDQPVEELPLPAHARIISVAQALTRLANPEPAPDLAETYAIQQVIPDLCAPTDGLVIRGAFHLAVPTTDRLLRLGPIPFVLPNRCRNGVAILLQRTELTPRTMAPAFRTRVDRQRLVKRLREPPLSLSAAAAECAATAFFPAISALLLGEGSGERSPAWKDPRWAEHLRRSYRRRTAGASPPWLLVDPARQGLAYAVMDAPEPPGLREVAATLQRFGVPNARKRTQQYTVDQRHARARTLRSWTWIPTVLRISTGRPGHWRARLRRCPACGGPAVLTVRVPELPYGCMCPCGGAPGLPADLRVPSCYRWLVPTREELAAYAEALLALDREPTCTDLKTTRRPR